MSSTLTEIILFSLLAVGGFGTSRAVHTDSVGNWDAHAHLSWYGEEALDLLTKSGVIAVRDCGGDIRQLKRWREEITFERRKWPRTYFSGPALDGPKGSKFRLTVTTPEEARKAVGTLARQGVDFIKAHNAIPREAYFA